MIKQKQIIVFVIGVISSISGIILRLSATDLAWPDSYSFSGARENTRWAIREQAYQDLAMVFLVFGLVLILIIVNNWLHVSSSVDKD